MAFTSGAPQVVRDVFRALNAAAVEANTSLAQSISIANAKFSRVPILDRKSNIETVKDKELLLGQDIKQFHLKTLKKVYGEKVEGVARDMISSFDEFLETYFPTTYFDDAVAWMTKVFDDGGTGVNPEVEFKLWERERVRIQRDFLRAADEASSVWASKGFLLPATALAHQAATVARGVQEQHAEGAREHTRKTWETELENTLLVVNKAVDLRAAAIMAAREYMNAMAVAPKLGLELTQYVQDTHAGLNNAMIAYHKHVREARSWHYDNQRYNVAVTRKREEVSGEWQLKAAERVLQMVLVAANRFGAKAASAVNGLHASAAVSGSDVTTIQILE